MRKPGLNFFLLLPVGLILLLAEFYIRWAPPSSVYMMMRNVVQQTHSEPSDDPVLGYLPRADLVKPFNDKEFHTMIKINSRHLRDKEYPFRKPEGVKRIVAVGGSFLFGWGVENEEILTEVLEEDHLSGTEVVNLGVSGYCANQELEWLRQEGLRYEPDLVLFFLSTSPINHEEAFVFENGKLYLAGYRASMKQKIVSWLRKHSALFCLLDNYHVSLQRQKENEQLPVNGKEASLRKEPSPTDQLLSSFVRLVSGEKWVPVFVMAPDSLSFAEGWTEEEKNDMDVLKGFCEEKGWGFLDLRDPLQQAWRSRSVMPYYKYDEHWNSAGHRIVAEALADYLKEKNFLEKDRFK